MEMQNNPAGCSLLRDLRLAAGTIADYAELQAFHYRGGSPRGVRRILSARRGGAMGGVLAGVLVETVPPLNCAGRELLLGARYAGLCRRDRALALNREVRTIARVIVHPLFRGLGVGTGLVRHALVGAETPYVEAFAAMGRVHPLFERAGMERIDVPPSREACRLEDALAASNLRPIDLVDADPHRLPAVVRDALRHFAKNKEAGPRGWLEEAQRRLLSRPVYYFWRAPEA